MLIGLEDFDRSLTLFSEVFDGAKGLVDLFRALHLGDYKAGLEQTLVFEGRYNTRTADRQTLFATLCCALLLWFPRLNFARTLATGVLGSALSLFGLSGSLLACFAPIISKSLNAFI